MHTHPTADCVCRPRHLCAPAKPGAAQIPQALPRLLCPAGTHDGGGPCGLLAALLRDGRSCMPGDGRLRGCLRAGCACLPATCLVAVPPAPPALLLLMPTSRPSPTARLQVYPERMAALPPASSRRCCPRCSLGWGPPPGTRRSHRWVCRLGILGFHCFSSIDAVPWILLLPRASRSPRFAAARLHPLAALDCTQGCPVLPSPTPCAGCVRGGGCPGALSCAVSGCWRPRPGRQQCSHSCCRRRQWWRGHHPAGCPAASLPAAPDPRRCWAGGCGPRS